MGVLNDREKDKLRERETKIQAKAFEIFRERQYVATYAKHEAESRGVEQVDIVDRLDQAFVEADIFVSRCEQRDTALEVRMNGGR